MVEQPEQDKQAGQKTIFNSDIGDDWGEAFEAEDFLTAPKAEANNEFFLPDLEATAGPAVGQAGPTAAAAAPADGKLAKLRHSLVDRLRGAALPIRLAVLGLPLAIGLALFFVLRHPHPTPKPPPKKPAKVQTTAQQAAQETHPQSKAPAPAPETTGHEPAPPAAAPAPKHPEPAAAPLILRKKWRLASVLIHTKADKDQESVFLTTDLTLTLRLPPEVMPPTDKDAFLREALYQFYTNQPPADLKRYALERGELAAKLKAWIGKQWPDLPLESISVDRYQLL